MASARSTESSDVLVARAHGEHGKAQRHKRSSIRSGPPPPFPLLKVPGIATPSPQRGSAHVLRKNDKAHLPDVEVNVVLVLVRNERAEISAHKHLVRG